LEILIMPVQPPPVTTEPTEVPQNDEKHVHPEIDRPPDRGAAPAGRASILVGAALLVLLTAGVVTFLNRKS
jgi:hypothetical protein